jgi:hypothetical protein
VIFVDVVLWMIVGVDTGWYGDPAVFKPFIGWSLVGVGWVGIYLAGAITCNTVYGKVIYPVPKPLIK